LILLQSRHQVIFAILIISLYHPILGGIFSGPGLNDSFFNATEAGIGRHSLTYTFLNATTDCTTNVTHDITVYDKPIIQLPSPFICNNKNNTLLLNFGYPESGVWSGPGVYVAGQDYFFDPSIAGDGNFTLEYDISQTIYNTVGCESKASIQITVVPIIGSISFAKEPLTYCPYESAVAMAASPPGGVFSGIGVSGNTFDPSVAGTGQHTINYNVMQNGCSVTASAIVTVFPLQVPTVQGIDSPIIQICELDDPLLLIGIPIGGQFITESSGYVPETSQFFPDNETGRHDFNYTIVYATGCMASTSFSIVVVAEGIGSCINPHTTTNFNDNETTSTGNFTDSSEDAITIIPESFPVWGVVLIIVGGLLLLAGIVVIIVVIYIKKQGDKIPERIELNQINKDGTVSSVTATRDMILSGTKVGSKN